MATSKIKSNADYVVEQGTSGAWTYRKRSSGITECWRTVNPGAYTIGTARGALYTGDYFTLNFPQGLFVATPTVNVSLSLATDNYVIFPQIQTPTNTSVSVRFCASAPVATSSGYTLHVSIIGKWK